MTQPSKTNNTVSNNRLQQLIADARARAEAINAQAQPSNEVRPSDTGTAASDSNSNASREAGPEVSITATSALQQATAFTWNAQQLQAIELIESGQSCCIVGSAGTGKTTLNREAVRRLTQRSNMPLLTAADATEVLQQGQPGIVCVSFTRSAVNNIRRALNNAVTCSTIHKLLEFKPTIVTVMDEETGEARSSKVFLPARGPENPLPANLTTIIVEESGIVNVRLFDQLLQALPDPAAVQFIFLGDLFQLDPPYDPAILGYALTTLPVVELTQVYRQALESPILAFAIDIKEQKTWGSQHFAALCKETEHGKLTVKPWKHRIDSFKATQEAAKFIHKEYAAGNWHPERSSIIIPFGAALNSKDRESVFGSFNLNKLIADFLGKERKAIVHEVIAGFNKHYLAIGDDVVYKKMTGKITNIQKNGAYLGRVHPQPASINLDRFGHNSAGLDFTALEADTDIEAEMDRLLAAASADNTEALRNASHVVTIELEEGGELELRSTGDFAPQAFDFSYAQTCYKAQGSEWDSVYVFTHKSHAVSLCNEFFYTGCTRARKSLTLICEPDHLMNHCKKQSIPGSNWQEKAAHFNTMRKRESISPFVQLLQWLHDSKQEQGE